MPIRLGMILLYFCLSLWSESNWRYLENEFIKIGVDLSRGACIGFFAETSTHRNLINHYDEGRFLQQSYYGNKDGSRWEGRKTDWVFNPVQGGSWDGKASKVISFHQDDTTMKATITPRHWANGNLLQHCEMQQSIELKDRVVKIHFSFRYNGPDQKVKKHQELPALFVDAELKYLCYTLNDELVKNVPALLEPGTQKKQKGQSGIRYGKNQKNWWAFIDDHDWGIGLLSPGTHDFTCYRALGDGQMGPEGSACSYVAPLQTFELTEELHFEYEIALTIGYLNEIETRFKDLSP